MGAIMAVGIAVSNSILLVSFANDLRVETRSSAPLEAALEAGRDAPAAGADDRAGDDHRHDPDGAGAGRGGRAERAARPRGDRRAAVATFVTLFVVPVVYSLLAQEAADASTCSKQRFLRRGAREEPDRGTGDTHELDNDRPSWSIAVGVLAVLGRRGAGRRAVIAMHAQVGGAAPRQQTRDGRGRRRAARARSRGASSSPADAHHRAAGRGAAVRRASTLYAKVTRLPARDARRQGRPGQGQPGDRGDRVARARSPVRGGAWPTPATSSANAKRPPRWPSRAWCRRRSRSRRRASAEVAEASVAALAHAAVVRGAARAVRRHGDRALRRSGRAGAERRRRADRRAAGGDHLAGRAAARATSIVDQRDAPLVRGRRSRRSRCTAAG